MAVSLSDYLEQCGEPAPRSTAEWFKDRPKVLAEVLNAFDRNPAARKQIWAWLRDEHRYPLKEDAFYRWTREL